MTTSHPTPPAGSFFLVSGLAGGREVFVGKALDASFDEHLLLEGKLVHLDEDGAVVVQPFCTEVDFFLLDSSFTVQRVTTEDALAEARQLLELAVSQVSPASFPFLHRWFLATCRGDDALELERTAPHANQEAANPLYGFYAGFLSTAEQFRRTLFQAREVTTSRELDKVAELEGNLVVEVGKVTNQAAVKFRQIVALEPDLLAHLEAYDGGEVARRDATRSAHATVIASAIGGFVHLLGRMMLAKSFARRSARAGVVRDINTLIKDAVFGLNEVVLDHANSLDTLITETFAQYGLAYELFGELSPYAGYTGPAPTGFTKLEPEPQAIGSR